MESLGFTVGPKKEGVAQLRAETLGASEQLFLQNQFFLNHHEATINNMKCLGFADGESGRFLDGPEIAREQPKSRVNLPLATTDGPGSLSTHEERSF